MSEIRELIDDEYPEMIRIAAEAYPGAISQSVKGRATAVENSLKARQDKSRKHWGLFRNNRMVAVFRTHDFNMNVHGHMIRTGGLGGVAVDLTRKKEGIAKEIVEFYLDYYDKTNTPMAALWPFRADFYHKMGFGSGARMFKYEIKPDALPKGKGKRSIRHLNSDDIPAINECYNRFVKKRNGLMESSVDTWSNRLEIIPADQMIGSVVDGKIDGFLTYKFKPTDADNFIHNNMIIYGLVYHSREALAQLLSFLNSQFDQINRIILHTDEDEFYMLLGDLRNESNDLLPSVYSVSHTAGVGIMYRVMNLSLLLKSLSGHNFGGESLYLKINLADSFREDKAGSYNIDFKKGKAKISEGGKADISINLDISEFSSMIMGAVGFKRLFDYSLVEISDMSYLDRVDKIFTFQEKPICMTGF